MLSKLLQRPWLLQHPSVQLKQVPVEQGFLVLRDDLLHPFASGNKLRKMDALLPGLCSRGVTDVLCCGGAQSAHIAAVACLCAEQGMRAHCLVRGERPAIPTGHLLLASMFGSVQHVTRKEYADRQCMLASHAALLTEEVGPSGKVAIIEEGACQPAALLGLIRLVDSLSASLATSSTGPEVQQPLGQAACDLVVDCGTGTSAVGLALGIALLGLPWRVHGVTLAGTADYYAAQQQQLVQGFLADACYVACLPPGCAEVRPQVVWRSRLRPRKFGSVLPGEVARCRQIAKQHGVLLDPVWTLSSWEVCEQLAHEQADEDRAVIMIHTGGALGLEGLAQRFPEQF